MSATLGEFEQLVLLALIRLGDEAYGVTVWREITRRTGRDADLASVYKALSRLEGKQLVTSEIGEPTPQRGGRRKKHFRVKPAGRRALQAAMRALRQMSRGLDAVLESP